MRTLASQPANKRYKIAGETLYIYAPLANRLGLNKIKTELEDLSFRYEHPADYENIQKQLSFTKEQRDKLFKDFTDPIRAALNEMGLKYEIKARVKTPYSIWNKMQTKHITFDEIYDILAVRIIFIPKERKNEINECFNIYIAISQIYKSHPDRLRDWLNHPKANGYQALHVTLMSKQGRWIEVQIRSDRMDEVAEQGFAAHWKYKDGEDTSEDDGELNEWLRTIKEILDDPQPDAMDFLDTIKLNLFASEIFVFTPKGEIKTMPAGCTALDFAFQIHTFLGSHCIGAKVNHKLVPLSHKLKSGDQVEILTSQSQHVQASWINFASTAKAKGKILAILRRDNRETQKKGEEMLNKWLADNGLEETTSIIDRLCEFHDTQKHENLFQVIGDKTIVLGDKDIAELRNKNKETDSSRWRKYVPFLSSDKKKGEGSEGTGQRREKLMADDEFDKKRPCVISEETIDMYIFRSCCHPIPGDDILGYIDNNKQIEIHSRACPVANKLKYSFGNRILDAKWDMHRRLFFDATIEVHGIDRQGMLRDVAAVLSDQLNVNITKITISSDKGIFVGTVDLKVHDRNDVKNIINSLMKINDMQDIQEII